MKIVDFQKALSGTPTFVPVFEVTQAPALRGLARLIEEPVAEGERVIYDFHTSSFVNKVGLRIKLSPSCLKFVEYQSLGEWYEHRQVEPLYQEYTNFMREEASMVHLQHTNTCPSCYGDGFYGVEEETGKLYICYGCAGTGRYHSK